MSVDTTKTVVERVIGVGVLVLALLGPQFVTDFWMDTVLTQTFILGIGAASLVFLSAYGGMISLAQAALMGIAGYALGNMVSQRGPGGETKGLTLGWDPTLAVVLAILLAVGIGLLFGAVASRSFGIYFLMLTLTYSVIAYLFVGQVTQVGGFSPIAGIDEYTPGFVGDIVNDRQRLYYVALGVAIGVYVLIRYLVRTPFGISLQGIRDEPLRMASLGYNVALHRTLAFGIGALVAAVGGVLFAWWSGPALALEHRAAGDDRAARDRRDRRVDPHRGRVARRVRLHRHQQRGDEQDPVGRLAGDRRHLQHRHRPHLSRHRHRLTRWADGDLGSLWDLARSREPERPAPEASASAASDEGSRKEVGGDSMTTAMELTRFPCTQRRRNGR